MRGDGLAAARAAVADAGRRLAQRGLVLGTSGNLSARHGDRVAVSPTGAVLGELVADDVTVVDLDGTVVAGALAPTSELRLHLEIYRRYDAGAVVHTHAPIATAVACIADELPCIHYQMLELGGPVRVAPYRTFGTPELAAEVATALDGRAAALMSNHGAVTTGSDVMTALQRMLLLEWLCDVWWRAASVGTPRVLDDEEQAAFRAQVDRLGYGRTRPYDGQAPA